MTEQLVKLSTAMSAIQKDMEDIVTKAFEGWEAPFEAKQKEFDALEKQYKAMEGLANRQVPTPEQNTLKSLPLDSKEADDRPEEAGGNDDLKNKAASINIKKGVVDLSFMKAIVAIHSGREADMKDLGITQSPRGAWLLRPEISEVVIERLESALVFDKLGVSVFPILGVSLEVPAENSDITGYWVAENTDITASDFTGGSISLQQHWAAAAVAYSKQLLASPANAKIQEILLRRLTNRLRRLIEESYLYGTGAIPIGGDANNTGSQPRGLTNIPGIHAFNVGASLVDNVATGGNADGGIPTLTDFSRMMQMIEVSDVDDMGTRAWLMHPRQKALLRELADLNGRQYFVENPANNREPAMLYGYPIYTTTQIKTDEAIGAATDSSSIFFAEWEHFMTGNSPQIEIESSEHVGFMKRQVVTIASVGTDCQVAYPQAFVRMTGARLSNTV